MTKKSVLLATLLAGMSAFTGCDKQTNKTSVSSETAQQVKKILDTPIFLNEMPHAMIIPNGKGEYTQLLYPVQKDGTVIESKDQYEKRVKWLNENDLVDIPKGHTLAGCRWQKRTKSPQNRFVSFFDNKEYIYRHIDWQQKFFNLKTSEVIKKDPVVCWWVAQTEFENKKSNMVIKNQREKLSGSR